jgi:hypothetical protein
MTNDEARTSALALVFDPNKGRQPTNPQSEVRTPQLKDPQWRCLARSTNGAAFS